MKTSLKTFFLAALCTGGFTLLPTGCTSTSPVMGESTGEYIDDSTITNDVSSQLVEDLGIKKEKVQVQTLHGAVTLTGEVENQQLRARAERIARDARGVHDVKDEITLMGTAPLPPAQP